MVGVNVSIRGRTRYKKLWVEETLTELYRKTAYTPGAGYILSSGDIVINKGSDNDSIILFINKKNKKNEHPVCKKV